MPRFTPFVCKPELVRGCSQHCAFCAWSYVPWNKEAWQWVKPDLFYKVCDDLATWLPKFRMEIAGRGEPAFHPKLLDMLAYARKVLPQVQILLTTNGDQVRNLGPDKYKDFIHSVLDAGGNKLLIDCYTSDRYDLMRSLFVGEANFFFEENVHPYGYTSPKTKQIILVNAVPGKDSIIRYYKNHAGSVDTAKAKAAGFNMHEDIPQAMCVRPFRELIINVDGRVPICCDDWMDEGIIGKFPEESLQTLWYKLDKYRVNLLKHDRQAQAPCKSCSERPGMRWGITQKEWGFLT